MIKGMTGFGNTQLLAGEVKATVEVRSLNHRYFDVNFSLPSGFGSLENKIRQLVQRKIERGRVTLSIRILQKPQESVVLNQDTVRSYLKSAKQLRRGFGLKNNLSLSDILRLPGVFEVQEKALNVEALWPILKKSIDRALKGLVAMRKSEGRSLSIDIFDKLKRMMTQVKKIRGRAKKMLQEHRKKMTAEEFSSLQKSSDVNEEISRLMHYIDQVKQLLKSNVAVGKKIDFVAQEMQRETNTIGAKLQDKVVSNAVIALKSKIEKIREQAQNIE